MKFIVLRGPSGSGKSSVAALLRSHFDEPTALVGQDYLRRIVLKEKDIPNGNNHDLIKHVVLFTFKRGYNVILEGIFDAERYEHMFKEILEQHPNDNHFFYFDVSLDETLRRHQSKPNKDDFGENEMRQWYDRNSRLKHQKEVVIPELDSLEAAVERVLSEIG
ncbi:MAG: AAA family ATPase [Candidatus Uhrbacteria bacterium]|nr:kinase [Patescibacteria group bacterium]MBU1907329.1 kinase [Patescibacteria group bacterium]